MTRKYKKNKKIKKLIAIGDLHGDYYRFIRILRENNLLKKNSLKWNTKEKNTDLVLMGDYEDWRGEPLEGSPDTWVLNIRKLLEYIIYLGEELKFLRKKRKTFKSRIHLLLGNHDKMMLDSHDIVKGMGKEEFTSLSENLNNDMDMRSYLFGKNYTGKNLEKFMYFLNWFTQGGKETIRSFGSFDNWFKSLNGNLGKFYGKNLKLAVKINGIFFSHTIPDNKSYWMSVKDINKELKTMPDQEKEELIKSYIWSRKIFGFDINTGSTAAPFSEEEIDDFLKIAGAKALVVGHTPMFTIRPIREYNGKVINLDVHGVPGAGAFVEEY
ncbi:MAG: metallophosphoesterase [Armatimonadota bacterium]